MKAVNVDLDLCQGHGKCYMVAAGLFDYADDHGRAEYVGGPIDTDDAETLEKAQRAIDSCPEYALSLVEHDHTGETA